ncbi:MAG: hypothetical protein H0T62_09030 [Parachlamydiaceae bacterium]|nr:hypothetical protein [Parachlamydiaceae bacterium]
MSVSYPSYQDNFLIAPLFNYNDKFCAAWTHAYPNEFGSAALDLMQRIVIVVIAPLAYFATCIAALIGLAFDFCIREKKIEQLVPNLAPDSINSPLIQQIQKKVQHITYEELLIQETQTSLFKGFDLMMKSDRLDDFLTFQYANNPNVLCTATIDADLEDYFDKDNENGFLALLADSDKPNANFVLIPILHTSSQEKQKGSIFHYTGIVFDIKNQSTTRYNSFGGEQLLPLEKKIVDSLIALNMWKSGENNTSRHQNDGWSCVYRVMNFFEAFLKGDSIAQINHYEKNITEFHTLINDYLDHLVSLETTFPDTSEKCQKLMLKLNKTAENLDGILPLWKRKLVESCGPNSSNNTENQNTVDTLFAFLSKHPTLIEELITKNNYINGWLNDTTRNNLTLHFSRLKNNKAGIIDTFSNAYFSKTGKPIDQRQLH